MIQLGYRILTCQNLGHLDFKLVESRARDRDTGIMMCNPLIVCAGGRDIEMGLFLEGVYFLFTGVRTRVCALDSHSNTQLISLTHYFTRCVCAR